MRRVRAARDTVKIGSRWQFTIPKDIREKFAIRPGQTLWMKADHGGIQIFVEKPAEDAE